ncbi:MAG: hypothetical protein LKG13_01295, partial [Atopobiaceae bacterium]|nr:hypothetical protein [Atopobiaceae bacterium]
MTDKLIIVCEDGEKKYATYLRQLVSARDDEENKQVGTKDGGVEAVIWNGKQYQDNLVKLTSLNHVLFIGDTNLGKTVRANVKDVCYEPGMHCGMLGTQSYMYVENNSMNKDNYKDFCALCEKYGKRFEKKLDLRY